MKKLLLAMLSALVCLATPAQAQTFPSKPVKIIASLPVGSGPDNAIRKVAEQLSERWGQPVVIENKPGGASALALDAFNKESDDGHVILFADSALFVSYGYLYNKPEALKGIDPFAGLLVNNMMLITSPDVKSLAHLKEIVTAKPAFGSWAVGSPGHVVGSELAAYFKIPASHVAYKEYGPWFVDISSGTLPYGFASIASSRQLQAGGKLKYLAYTGDRRDPRYPDVPTLKELTGHHIGHARPYTILALKETTNKAVKDKITKDFRDVLATAKMRETITAIGYLPDDTPADFKKFIDNDIRHFRRLATEYNISIQ